MVEPSSAYWIETLGLRAHPEGGYFRETYRSSARVGARAVSTAIYYLLPCDQVGALHRIASDELWHFYTGASLTLHLIHVSGRLEQLRLGPRAAHGESFQAAVPAGTWFGATVDDPVSYALVGCTVAPGFEYVDFERGERARLLAEYPQHRALIERLTR